MEDNTPSFKNGFLWFLFSGTAMVSAILFPVTVFAIVFHPEYGFRWDTPLAKLYFGIIFFSAIYHGIYRLVTVLFDLGVLKKGEK